MTSSLVESSPSRSAPSSGIPPHGAGWLGRRFTVWFPLAVFVVSRAVNTLMFDLASRRQIAIPSSGLGGKLAIASPASPNYWVVAANWDGRWYGAIATYGYPDQLPVDSAGHVLPNAYAFPPLYPMLVRLLMLATGLDFTRAGPILSFACGAGAMVLVYRLVADSAGRRAGAFTVVLVCAFISAPVFQISYTEGLTLLLVTSALTLLSRRRYALVALVLFLLSLTRPLGLAVVVVVVVHGLVRYRNRSEQPFDLRDRLWVVGVAGFGSALVGLWPMCAALMSGQPNAYYRSMAAWSQDRSMRVLIAWPVALWQGAGIFGLLALIMVVMACVWLVRRRGSSRWSVEVRAWAWAYPLFLFFATGPGTSTIRYGVLAFPLIWPFVERAPTPFDRRVQNGFVLLLVVVGLVAQWVWIRDYVVVTAGVDGTFP